MKYCRMLSLLLLLFLAQYAYADSALDNNLILNAINKKIENFPTLKDTNINITLQNNVATLIGTVNTIDQASLLIAIADSIPGVRDVDTASLVIKEASNNIYDLILTAKVKGALVREKVFPGYDVNNLPIAIHTSFRIVYLVGLTDNIMQRRSAILVSQAVPGVMRVISELTIRFSPMKMP